MTRTALQTIDIAICDATNEALVHSGTGYRRRSALTNAVLKMMNALEVSVCELADAEAAAERAYRNRRVAEVVASFGVGPQGWHRQAAVALLDSEVSR